MGELMDTNFKTKEEGFEKLKEIIETMLTSQYKGIYEEAAQQDYIDILCNLTNLGVSSEEIALFKKPYMRKRRYREMFEYYENL